MHMNKKNVVIFCLFFCLCSPPPEEGIGFYKPLIISADPPGALSPLIGLVTLIFFFISIRENN